MGNLDKMPTHSLDEAKNEANKMEEKIETGEAANYSEAEKIVEKEKIIKEIKDRIEDARKNRLIDNEVANLVSDALELGGNDALFANRVISRGSDPASLELAMTGTVSDATMRAHNEGPGALTEDEKEDWLVLAAASIDENAKADLPITEKFNQFRKAVNWLENASEEEKKEAAQKELEKILNLPFTMENIGGVDMQVYTSDRGFASAYWSGKEYAAVKQGSMTFIGSQEKSLKDIGVEVDKELSPTFGIIFDKSR